MKSKALDLKRTSGGIGKSQKPFDFISLYKSVAETKNIAEKHKTGDELNKENSFSKSKNESKRENLPSKKKKKLHEPLDISRINVEGPSLDSININSSLNESKVTSTPRASNNDKNQVKSIMKNSSTMSDSTVDESKPLSIKSKKRNKSVSFMLDDNEEVVKKKTKSTDSLVNEKQSEKPKLKKKSMCKFMKMRKVKNVGKETALEGDSGSSETVTESSNKSKDISPDVATSSQTLQEKNKKNKKSKKRNNPEPMDTLPSNAEKYGLENKKNYKKKQKVKSSQSTEAIDHEEPSAKLPKTDVKPELIAQNLESLSIGDNAHTLTSLLDEMTVADKSKKKKNKRKHKKNKIPATSISSTENGDIQNEVKEKVKWRRKWNKDKKGEVIDDTMTSVLVENLPLSLMCMYKTVLAEHFAKCGLIKRVGVAEMYPGDSNMTFTTTINFYSDGAATQALEEDGVDLGGNCIHVKRPLSPTQTTVVVRSYASLSDQVICTAFSGAGKIRSIRHLIKGKKSIGDTVFIEFDGPETVQRALELADGAKVAGKKLHVARFEIRKKKSRTKPSMETGNEGDSEGQGESEGREDSDNSND